MSKMNVPFNRPSISPQGMSYIQDVLRSSHHSGDGPYSKRCQEILEGLTGSNKVLLTTSCTHALEMAAILLDVQPEDEVILPSFTFVSTVNAFVLRGCKPVFVDIRPDTLNIDEKLIEAAITERTKVIVVVHYAGISCEMDTILGIAQRYGLPVVEDNAHGLFGKYQGKPLGSFGVLATQSFHETKNISCGEGGALLINDLSLTDRAEILREKGTNRSLFFRGEVDKYSWMDIGSSWLPSDILATLLLSQLEERDQIQMTRKKIWQTYHAELREWAALHEVRQPIIPTLCDQAWHLYYLLMPTPEKRDAFLGHLREAGVGAVFHYLPLHLSKFGSRFGGKEGDLPVTEALHAQLVRLPFYTSMTESDQAYVIQNVLSFKP